VNAPANKPAGGRAPQRQAVIDPRKLPAEVRRLAWWAAVIAALLLAVVFLLGFTAGRWFEHGR
jgi:hypothetical protein